jgi:hypothetical protein
MLFPRKNPDSKNQFLAKTLVIETEFLTQKSIKP